MPRGLRCLLPSIPCHITQRGVDRRETFFGGEDFHTYIDLLRQNLEDPDVTILAWCLMSNHLHRIAVPGRADSMTVPMRRVQSRYAQYYNAHSRRNGHLWQNASSAAWVAPSRLWTAIAYVELNPVRARMVARAEDYLWSSAVAHVTGGDGPGLRDMDWLRSNVRADWRNALRTKAFKDKSDDHEAVVQLRACTFAERPFGDDDFVAEMAERFGRRWIRGRPSKKSTLKPPERAAQVRLFPSLGSDET